MDKVLRPEQLETDPNSNTASKEWLHWRRTFENFLSVLPQENLDKLSILTSYVSPTIFQYIETSAEYAEAIEVLKGLFVKPTNEIYTRHMLATRCQQSNETLDEYLQALKALSKDCNFKTVTAAQYCDECIRDAFITGLQSSSIRQRLLENKTLDLKTMFDQAHSIESAMRSSESYTVSQPSFNAAVSPVGTLPVAPPVTIPSDQPDFNPLAAVPLEGPMHFFCGNSKHFRSKSPAREAICMKCQKKGHFARVCRGKSSNSKNGVSATLWSPTLATLPARAPGSLSKSSATVAINGWQVKALFDSGSSESFIHPSLVETVALSENLIYITSLRYKQGMTDWEHVLHSVVDN